jgi:hypothetical protein
MGWWQYISPVGDALMEEDFSKVSANKFEQNEIHFCTSSSYLKQRRSFCLQFQKE